MMQNIISISDGIARNPIYRLQDPININFCENEHLAIIGLNGSGKSILVDTLLGKYPLAKGTLSYDFFPSLSTMAYDNIKYMAFRDSYGAADANYYYQQRWNAHDQDDAPTVREMLGEVTATNSESDKLLRDKLFTLFAITPMLDKKIILLSSGELRKMQLTKALLTHPRVLVLDNPFIGLDVQTRELLHKLLVRMTQLSSLQIILVLSMIDDVPDFITHVLPITNMRCGEKMTREAYLSAYRTDNTPALSEEKKVRIINLSYKDDLLNAEQMVELNKVSIKYGDRTILKELDWTVMRGDKWALSGENGAGKSTLLSLVCADNPQSYACNITLFGHRRGSGESIWEIKKHIGYVSPEMHRAYLKNLPTIEIVASGLHDSIGIYKRPCPEQMDACEWWMDIFGIKALKDRPFLQLSSGEQRLVLLARAFVKDPELLILDEPLHGLDTRNRRLVKAVIEAFCCRKDKTLIMVTHYEEELPCSINHRMRLTRMQ
ncbi:MAG: ATP-binding cassette domain-containing protein [Bacteroidaceae bacterium]